jgi:hypothetical protein
MWPTDLSEVTTRTPVMSQEPVQQNFLLLFFLDEKIHLLFQKNNYQNY